MFTGIIETGGLIERVSILSSNERMFSIASSYEALTIGESIAINGVCLTVTLFSANKFNVYASEETLRRTNLRGLRAHDKVNLERSLRLDAFVGGHLVMGHIDEVAKIIALNKKGESIDAVFSLPKKVKNMIIEKASIAINGISLTINEVRDNAFHINLIPATIEKTTFMDAKVGDSVNVEVDIIARYVYGMLNKGIAPELTQEYLQNVGFSYEKNRTGN